MRFKSLLAHLPAALALDIRMGLEEAAPGNHLTKDEVREIVHGIFARAATSEEEAELLTDELREAIVSLYF
jgi:hypothetical protein